MSATRDERAKNLEIWVEGVDADDLRVVDTDALRHIVELVDTDALRHIVELVDRRRDVDAELEAAVRAARAAHRSWSEIGSMLGVSKQAAQRKYSNKTHA